tara:strand:+ start:482 stop:643 length:162 start_codon:yes stop_codon:yes gene_type:complete
MERINRQFIEFIRQIRKDRFVKILNKNKKEVNINGNGTHRYTIKEGINKGKVL